MPENSEASLLGAAAAGFTALNRYPNPNAAASAMIRRQTYAGPANDAAEKLYLRFLDCASKIG